jgi:hypothetical protein
MVPGSTSSNSIFLPFCILDDLREAISWLVVVFKLLSLYFGAFAVVVGDKERFIQIKFLSRGEEANRE